MNPYITAAQQLGMPKTRATESLIKWHMWLAWGMAISTALGLMAILYIWDASPKRLTPVKAFCWFLFWFLVGVVVCATVYKTKKERVERLQANELNSFFYHKVLELAQHTNNTWAPTTHNHTYKDGTGRILDRHDNLPDEDRPLTDEEYLARFGTLQPGKKHQEWQRQQWQRDMAEAQKIQETTPAGFQHIPGVKAQGRPTPRYDSRTGRQLY